MPHKIGPWRPGNNCVFVVFINIWIFIQSHWLMTLMMLVANMKAYIIPLRLHRISDFLVFRTSNQSRLTFSFALWPCQISWACIYLLLTSKTMRFCTCYTFPFRNHDFKSIEALTAGSCHHFLPLDWFSLRQMSTVQPSTHHLVR
jgi:hypothetical protein